jgi:hypothetical protein
MFALNGDNGGMASVYMANCSYPSFFEGKAVA